MQIIKCQQSLSSSLPYPTVLMYNKDRSWTYQGPIDDEIDLALNGKNKVFFNVSDDEKLINGQRPRILWGQAEDQDW